MAQATKKQDGFVYDHTPSSAVAAGDIVISDSFVGAASQPIAANILGSVDTSGIWDIVKVTGAISIGVPIYWDADGDPLGGTAGSGCATATVSDNVLIGYATVAAVETATTVEVMMTQTSGVTIHGQLTKAITDPGDGNAIPVIISGSCPMTSAGAETRTLAIPAFLGQQLSLHVDVYVGDIVLTVAAPVNVANNNTLTFGQVSDACTLIAVQLAGVLVWQIDMNDGVALTTV